MSTILKVKNSLLKEILDVPLGNVVAILERYLKYKIEIDLIEQNISKLGSRFTRKISITANNLPLIIATIKFDKNILSPQMMSQLLQKTSLVGDILKQNNIPNEKKIISMVIKNDKIVRIYQIKFEDKILFEVSEVIRLDLINEFRMVEVQDKINDEKFQSLCWEAMGPGW